MKFTEIKEKAGISSIQIRDVGFVEKCSIVESIVDFSIVEDVKQELYFEMMADVLIAKAYLDCEFDIELTDVNKFIEAYEILVSLGFSTLIFKDERLNEADALKDMARQQVDNEIAKRHSIALVLKEGLEKLINAIPDEKAMSKLLTKLPKALDKLSPENRDLILKAVGK